MHILSYNTQQLNRPIYSDILIVPMNCRVCGCYGRQNSLQSTQPIKIPLTQVAYEITLLNGIAEVQIKQTYHNFSDKYLQLEYRCMISPNACLHKFVALFSKRRMEGVVKEKQLAIAEYKQAQQIGKKAALGIFDPQNKDIMVVQIGNIGPGEQVAIQLSYIEELSLSLNTFYEFNLITNHKVQGSDAVNSLASYKKIESSFILNLKTTRKIRSYRCFTNQLVLQNKNEQNTAYFLTLGKGQQLSQKFKFIYTTQDFQLPSYSLGRTDAGSSVMISFIPKFCHLSIGDAEVAALQGKTYDMEMDSVKGEYLFLLDRSGSMGGSRIKSAKKALILFLKSLPIDAYFNVISFGTNSQKLFKQSKKNGEQQIKQALGEIQAMDADLGGTNILKPITNIFKSEIIKGYPRHLFLLTDGEVSQSQKVIKLKKNNINYSRVHTIGIGASSSDNVLQNCAEYGKGKCISIDDGDNFAQKIIQLLNDTFSPVISEVSLLYDQQIVESIIPLANNMPYILKDQIVNFYITFRGQLLKQTKISFNYRDSVTKQLKISEQIISPDSPSQIFVDKMSSFKRIRELEQKYQTSKEEIEDFIFLIQRGDKKAEIINLSVRNQILSKFTGFICVQTQLIDGRYEQIKGKGQQKIKIDSVISYDSFGDFSDPKSSQLEKAKSNNNSNACFSAAFAENKLFDLFQVSQPAQISLKQINNSNNLDLFNFDCEFTSCPVDVERQQSQDNQVFKGFSFGQQKKPNLNFMIDFSKQTSIQPKNQPIKPDIFSFQDQFFGSPKKREEPQLNFSLKTQTYSIKNALFTQEHGLDILGIYSSTSTSPPPKKIQSSRQSPKIDISQIIQLQKFEGNWNNLELIRKIFGENLSTKISNLPSMNVIITFLLIKWLQIHYPQTQYKLLLKKGRSWLQKQSSFTEITKQYQQYVK